MFLIKSLNTPIQKTLTSSPLTQVWKLFKLCHPRALSTNHHHFYFNQIVRLCNHMPVIDIRQYHYL